MTSKAVTDFVETILLHFPPFRWDEEQEKAWAATMVRELACFQPDVLRKAAETMIRSRRERRIPLVSECIDACSDAKRWLDANKRASSMDVGQAPPTASEMKWAERERLADDLIACPLGQSAAREGWIGALHAYAVKFGRLPQQGELTTVKAQAKDFDSAYADVVRGEAPDKAGEVRKIPPMMLSVLQKLGADMLAKRRARERRVLGK